MSLTLKGSSGLPEAKTQVKKAESSQKTGPGVSFVQKVLGNDTYLVMAKSAVELEDEFANLYFTTEHQTKLFLQPPFDPQVMLNLAQTNNTLNQCVEAMEVNVDGTGHDFVKVDEDTEIDPQELEAARALFSEPYPGHSMIKIRRKMRREIESVGYAYLEVLRNAADEIVGWRNINSHNVRMVKLGPPRLVTKKLVRGGKEVEMKMWMRDRMFGQRVAMQHLVYYKEFGVDRHLNRKTGEWEELTDQVKKLVVVPEDRATELLMIGLHPDIRSPYFVPRWVNQMPSVVGSRKAEEQNLEFFDSGGMPPAIVFIQGGALAGDAAEQLKQYLSGKNKNKYRAVVVEAQSSSGSLESAGTVQVKVERFGGEKANDALYQTYDKNAEERVRMGFRLPPLFLGKAADYNFATAITAYMVAEAQVFKPERDLFDEMVNTLLLRTMGFKTLKFKSKPITLQDVANQMKAIELSKDLIKPESVVESLNDITGLELEALPPPPKGAPTLPGMVADGKGGHELAPEEPPIEPSPLDRANEVLVHSQAAANDIKAGLKPGTTAAALEKQRQAKALEKQAQQPARAQTQTPGTPPPRPGRKTAMELIELAKTYAMMNGLLVQKREITEEQQIVTKFEIDQLSRQDRQAFDDLLASYTFGQSTPDLVSITSCNHVH